MTKRAELRTIRDKLIVHNEDFEVQNWISWKSMNDLLDFAKEITGIIGWAYCSTVYSIQGDYMLTQDAKNGALFVDRVLTKLGYEKNSA